MDPSRPYAHRRVVWFALGVLLLFPVLIGCASSVGVDPPLDQFNIEYLRLLKLGDEGFEEAKEPERLVSAEGTTVAIASDDATVPESLALVDDTTLAIGTYDRLYFADLSDPAGPVVVSVFEYEGEGVANVLEMGGFVYGFTPSGELLAVDARQPAEPKLADSLVGNVRNQGNGQVGDLLLAAVDGFLYVRTQGGIQILNAADPYALELERAVYVHEGFPVEGSPCSRRIIRNAKMLGATVQEGLMYVWVDRGGCVGPETRLTVQPTVTEGNYASEPAPVSPTPRHVAANGGFWVLDVSVPANPRTVSFLSMYYPEGGWDEQHEVVAAENYVYLDIRGELHKTVAIIDVSQPSEPKPLIRQLNAELVVWEDSLLFVSIVHVHNSGFFSSRKYSHGLQVFDVSDAAIPILIGMISKNPVTDQTFYSINDVAFRDGHIYVAEGNIFRSGIHVLRLIDRDWRPDDAPAEASDN